LKLAKGDELFKGFFSKKNRKARRITPKKE